MDDHRNLEDSESNAMARWARRLERCCCTCATYFPLFFVYGLTSWAVWALVLMSASPSKSEWLGTTSSLVGISLYGLLNWSYTTAVFTDPGSTTGSYALAKRGGEYSALPTRAPPSVTNFTVKSNGDTRYCKKCHARKPDRAHHCSTCRRCVLKMDHHCPWLATCIGLHNHKAFLLFLIYTSVFCLYCFAASGSWTYYEVFASSGTYTSDTIMPVNYIMLCVVSGIIGFVVAIFTGWHIHLASKGQTTIECLEKTRYLSPLRKQLQANFAASHSPGTAAPSYGQQLLDIHSNALPGITRPEEGEDIRRESPSSSATTAPSYVQPLIHGPTPPAAYQNGAAGTNMSYAELERHRERRRYEEYLDDQDSSKMTHAFDLGPKRNLLHLFGEKWHLWGIPVCNTTGDGWSWEASPHWLDSRDRLARERGEQRNREQAAGWGEPDSPISARSPGWTTEVTQRPQGSGRFYETNESLSPYATHNSNGNNMPGRKTASKADRVLGRDPNLYIDSVQPVTDKGNVVGLKRLSSRGVEIPEPDSDEDSDSDSDSDPNLDSDRFLHAEGKEHTKRKAGATGGVQQQGTNMKMGGRAGGLMLQPGGPGGLLRKKNASSNSSSSSASSGGGGLSARSRPIPLVPSPRLGQQVQHQVNKRGEGGRESSEDDGVD